jgi:PAS domain S-box-containing protein
MVRKETRVLQKKRARVQEEQDNMDVRQIKILLVEDDEDDYVLIRDMLSEIETAQFDLRWAATYEAARKALGQGDLDAVLVDYRLGEHDGIALVREAIAEGCRAPIVLLTGQGGYEVDVAAMEAGAVDYLVKDEVDAPLLERTLRYAVAHKRSEAALRASEARYRSLFDRVPVGLYRVTPDGQTLDVNPALVQMLGYADAESLIACNAADLYVNAGDRRRQQALVEREGVVRGFEMQLRRCDGTIIWVRDTLRAIRDAEGQVLYDEGALEDITEQVRAREALLENRGKSEARERFITRVLESIPSSLVVIDPSLRIVSANHNFLEKMRRTADTVLGCRVEEVFPRVLVEYTGLDRKVRDVFRTGQQLDGGKVAYRAPGLPTRTYYYRLVPLRAAESVDSVMLLMDDITEREQLREEVQRAERHLASVVECANDLIVSADAGGNILTWNQAAEGISGLHTEQVRGQPLLSLCAAEQQEVMAEMLARLTKGQSIQNIEVNLITADSRKLPIAWSCAPIRNPTQQVAGIVLVGRDLTERHQLQAQLIQSAKMASLGVMGIISAGVQLMSERLDDAQLRSEGIQKIYAATQRASLIIENLLKFARPQNEQMQECDPHAVLEETLALLAHQMTLQKVVVKKEFQPHLPKIYGNPPLLQQVFANLILNARNAMPDGGNLTVTTRAVKRKPVSSTDPPSGIEIRFCDTGTGIPVENLERIFDPFFTTMPVGKGVGLGLSISYSIIQQHRGTIQVESQAGQGTTFTVWLPSMAQRIKPVRR